VIALIGTTVLAYAFLNGRMAVGAPVLVERLVTPALNVR
jgi:hypothetical protein